MNALEIIPVYQKQQTTTQHTKLNLKQAYILLKSRDSLSYCVYITKKPAFLHHEHSTHIFKKNTHSHF